MALIKDRTQGMQGITIYNQKWRLRDGCTLLLSEIVEKKPSEATRGEHRNKKNMIVDIGTVLESVLIGVNAYERSAQNSDYQASDYQISGVPTLKKISQCFFFWNKLRHLPRSRKKM